MRKASPRAEKMRPAKILRALEWAPKKLKPCASKNTHRQKMGRHLISALNQDGLEVGSHRTKYTQVALKNGTSFGPSLLTWKQIKYLTYQLSHSWMKLTWSGSMQRESKQCDTTVSLPQSRFIKRAFISKQRTWNISQEAKTSKHSTVCEFEYLTSFSS